MKKYEFYYVVSFEDTNLVGMYTLQNLLAGRVNAVNFLLKRKRRISLI